MANHIDSKTQDFVDNLYELARTGDAETIVFVIESEEVIDVAVAIDCVDTKHGNTPLCVACYEGQQASISALLEMRASVNAPNGKSWCPLIAAVRGGFIESVGIILQAEADFNYADDIGRNVFFHGVIQNDLEIFNLLFSVEGINIDAPSKVLETPLMYAFRYEHFEIAKLILESGKANINAVDTFGNSSLLRAVFALNANIVSFLLEQDGCDIDVQNDNGETAFFTACKLANIPIMQLLHSKVSNSGRPLLVNAVDCTKRTSLNWACQSFMFDIATELIGMKCDVNIADVWGLTPVMSLMKFSAYDAHKGIGENSNVNKEENELLRLLLRNKADPNISDRSYFTPLMVACMKRNIAAAVILIEWGADSTLVELNNKTAMDFLLEPLDENDNGSSVETTEEKAQEVPSVAPAAGVNSEEDAKENDASVASVGVLTVENCPLCKRLQAAIANAPPPKLSAAATRVQPAWYGEILEADAAECENVSKK